MNAEAGVFGWLHKPLLMVGLVFVVARSRKEGLRWWGHVVVVGDGDQLSGEVGVDAKSDVCTLQ